MKSQILGVLLGITLVMSFGLAQAADETNVALESAENVLAEMPGILTEVATEEMLLMAPQEMEESVGGRPRIKCRLCPGYLVVCKVVGGGKW